MSAYKTLASKPEDRLLLLAALPMDSEFRKKVYNAHANAELRRAPKVNHAVTISLLRGLLAAHPDQTQSLTKAIAHLENDRAATVETRHARAIANLNMTEADRAAARAALKAHAKAYPDDEPACRVLYQRIKP